jgi:uncharacterized membrane protein YgdD (TMEM256/DUF423 family)
MVKNITIACFLGLLSVILGAFGAHALKDVLTFTEIQSFQTAVHYQMYHVLVVLFLNIAQQFSEKQKKKLSLIFFIGIVLFSGSIYLIHLTSLSMKNLWFITPLGGVFFIFGWTLLLFYLIKKSLK